jgi:hypothetical protein
MAETQTDLSPPYTDAHIVAYPVEYIAGIDLYNAGEFHAAHDVWEDRWMGEVGPKEKLFLQAMIQSAVAFHHLEIGRRRSSSNVSTRKVCDWVHGVFMSLDLLITRRSWIAGAAWLLTVPDPENWAFRKLFHRRSN